MEVAAVATVDVAPYADTCVDWKAVFRAWEDHQHQDRDGAQGRYACGYIPRRAPYASDVVEMVGFGCRASLAAGRYANR